MSSKKKKSSKRPTLTFNEKDSLSDKAYEKLSRMSVLTTFLREIQNLLESPIEELLTSDQKFHRELGSYLREKSFDPDLFLDQLYEKYSSLNVKNVDPLLASKDCIDRAYGERLLQNALHYAIASFSRIDRMSSIFTDDSSYFSFSTEYSQKSVLDGLCQTK